MVVFCTRMHGQAWRARVPALVALVAAMLPSGCVEETNASAYDLSGVVQVESEDGGELSPLGGATVVFTSDTGLVAETVSEDDGRYEMQVLSDVTFGQVRAERSGFTPSEQTVFFDRPDRRVDFVLRPAPEE